LRLAIYDLDRTITRRPSWLPWLLHYAAHEAPWRLALLPLALAPSAAFVAGLTDRKGLKEQTQGLLIGRSAPIARVDRAARRFARRFGAINELPAALRQMEDDRRQGFRLLIATASCRYYARHLAARWGVDDLVATENRICANGRLSRRIEGPNCYGTAKLDMVRAHLAAAGIAATGTARPMIRFYSDHVSDLPCLEWADEPVAANPSAALRREAERRNWPVLDWR
jgi:HAD superfamily phosphoserine phosphatase-like hydrolase